MIPGWVIMCWLRSVSTRHTFVTFSSWHKLLIASGDLKCFTVSWLCPYIWYASKASGQFIYFDKLSQCIQFNIYIIRRNSLSHNLFLSSIFVNFYFVIPNSTNNNGSALWTYYLWCSTCAFHKEIATFRAINRMEYIFSALLWSRMIFPFSQHSSPPLNINIG